MGLLLSGVSVFLGILSMDIARGDACAHAHTHTHTHAPIFASIFIEFHSNLTPEGPFCFFLSVFVICFSNA